MSEVFRFTYNLVYIDRRPSRLALKLFIDWIATYEKKGKSVSLKLFSFFFSFFGLCIFLLFILSFYNNLLILVRRRDAKPMLLNNFCKLFQLRTIWYRIELMPYSVVLT